ncbi:iron-siderophore ABC transporter substrate-binding protein [Pseudonocardia kujensis]|uniref:iron-siderophore ABC transporter substrate-binding protein n=1 Tax=Pseudonocardia kujensis TaxID=1128675 RepID=UPI001E4A455F|nr:iron-siderophore ABC transporter substrate-binding protein [Pseudonocardia kujensis]MCE0766210.1 iron-siderophore ABC transporter substrate-binding protein [Pseudonocardia kujensis]
MPRPRPRTPRVLLPFLAVLALALAGCAGGPDARPAAPPAGAAEAGAFPTTVAHKFGSTTIEAEPKRVVAVGLTDQDAVLALGVVPVGTTEWFGNAPGALFPWAKARFDEIADGSPLPEVLPFTDGVAYERVAALRPDLILATYSGLGQADYDRLSRIAPTVAQPGDVPDYGLGWREQTTAVGAALGRPAAAAELVADVEKRFADARAAHPEFAGRTAEVATFYDGQYYVYGSKDPRGRVLGELGLTVPPVVDQLAGQEFGATVSLERSDVLDVDALIWLDAGGEGVQQSVLGQPSYTARPVHTEGRDLFVSYDGGSTLDPIGGFVTVLSLPVLLDALPDQLAALSDGDPATAPPAPTPLAAG